MLTFCAQSNTTPGIVVHAYNPSTLEAKAGRSLEVRSLRPAWPTWWNPVSTKNTKISRAWWHAPVIQLLRRLRQENCLNTGGGGCREPRLRHCTPAWVTGAKLHLKKKKKKKSGVNRCWRGHGEIGMLLYCWWECKLVQPLWKTVCRFLKDLEIEIPFYRAIPLLGICPKDYK